MSTGRIVHWGVSSPQEFTEQAVQTRLKEAEKFKQGMV